MRCAIVALVGCLVLGLSGSASASSDAAALDGAKTTLRLIPLGGTAVALLVDTQPVAVVPPARVMEMPRPQPARPQALIPLYVSFAALQALDAHSTLSVTRAGGDERNPLVQPVASHPAGMIALKVATGAATVLLTERLWKRHRMASVAFMVAINAGYAAIVAHNYRVGR